MEENLDDKREYMISGLKMKGSRNQ